MTDSKIWLRQFPRFQIAEIINCDCPSCPSREGEVCVGVPTDYSHTSRVKLWVETLEE